MILQIYFILLLFIKFYFYVKLELEGGFGKDGKYKTYKSKRINI